MSEEVCGLQDMRIAWEEPFGPVIPVIRVKTIDDAIDHCNSNNLALQVHRKSFIPVLLVQEAAALYTALHAAALTSLSPPRPPSILVFSQALLPPTTAIDVLARASNLTSVQPGLLFHFLYHRSPWQKHEHQFWMQYSRLICGGA